MYTISSDLREYLIHHKLLNASVHSIFEQTVNLVDQNNELISIVSKARNMAPMTLRLDFREPFVRGIETNEQIIISDHEWRSSSRDIKLSLNKASIWPCECHETNAHYRDTYANRLAKIDVLGNTLRRFGNAQGLLPLIDTVDGLMNVTSISAPLESNYYCVFIQDTFVRLIQALHAQNYEGVLALLPKFIGFGPGLTPATDDFLLGMLGTLAYDGVCHLRIWGAETPIEEIHPFLEDAISITQGRTTKVSETMLKHGCRGKLEENYSHLLRLILVNPFSEENLKTIEMAVVKIIAHGSTSGSDYLLGVYAIQRLLIAKHVCGS